MIRSNRRIYSPEVAPNPPPESEEAPAHLTALEAATSAAAALTPLLEAPLLEESDGALGESAEGAADVNAGWVELVERIRLEKTDGMEELYQLFSRGIRFYLCRQLGPQELDDKVHDTFVVVVFVLVKHTDGR